MLLVRVALLSPLLLVTPAATGCLGGMCTLVAVEDGLRLEVRPAAPMPADDYALIVRAEGREVRADISITAEGGLCADPCRQDVDLGDGRTLRVDPIMTGTGGWLQIGIPGVGGPDVVEVELRRGTATVAIASYQPDYETEEPNGNGCGEVTVARGTFNIPALPSAGM